MTTSMQIWVFSVSNVWIEIHHSVLRYLWSVGSSLSTPLLICVWQTKFIQYCWMLLNWKKSLKCKMLTLKCFSKMAKCEMQELQMLRNAARRCGSWKVTKRDFVVASTRYHRARLLKYITRDHRARLVSSNRECFAHYRHIFYLLSKSSLSLNVYTLGFLG